MTLHHSTFRESPPSGWHEPGRVVTQPQILSLLPNQKSFPWGEMPHLANKNTWCPAQFEFQRYKYVWYSKLFTVYLKFKLNGASRSLSDNSIPKHSVSDLLQLSFFSFLQRKASNLDSYSNQLTQVADGWELGGLRSQYPSSFPLFICIQCWLDCFPLHD